MLHRALNPQGWRTTILVAVCGGLLGMWLGCTPQKRYQVLSFFFDGVPNPDAPVADSGKTATAGTGPRIAGGAGLFVHKPFGQQQCAACHGSPSGGDIAALDAGKCLECHKSVPTRYTRMHGPVVAGVCLWCHAPHESTHPALLRASGQEICTQCHEYEVLPASPPAHQDRQRDCLSCHVAHGSNQRMLLRATATTGATTREAR